MKLDEIYHHIDELKKSMYHLFEGVEISCPFINRRTSIGDWSDKGNMGMVVTGDDVGKKSGVYFFAKPDEEVFYIGKAASLHGRVWGHVNTPINSDDGKKLFPNHKFTSNDSMEEIRS